MEITITSILGNIIALAIGMCIGVWFCQVFYVLMELLFSDTFKTKKDFLSWLVPYYRLVKIFIINFNKLK